MRDQGANGREVVLNTQGVREIRVYPHLANKEGRWDLCGSDSVGAGGDERGGWVWVRMSVGVGGWGVEERDSVGGL